MPAAITRRAFASIALAASACSKSRADPFEPIREKIRAELPKQGVSSLTVAVGREGEIVWEEGFGLADRERQLPATPHTAYSMASISKPITATGLMLQVERGHVALDKPANDYLGDAKINGRAFDAAGATIAAVASHTSGLPLHYQFFLEGENYPRPSMDETIAHYANLVTQPGEKYQYCNLGFGILDYVIERSSGKPYPEFMRDEVFRPLGMELTAVPISSQDLGSGQEWAVRYWNLETPLPFYDFDHRGASAVYSCAHDLVRFGMSHLGQADHALLKAESIQRMQQPIANVGQGSGYGLGWRVDESRMGVRAISHNGGMGGVATSLTLAPEHNLVVVVLTNAGSGLAHEISHDIFATLIPEYQRNLEESRARKPDEEKKAAPLPESLQGVWQGTVETYQASLPFRLEVAGPDKAQASLADAAPVPLTELKLDDGYLTAALQGDIGTPDANRRDYDLRLSLKPRGDVLNGACTAVGKPSPKLPNALTSWTELRKV
jgi:CubicO group peptidase (beta-lactamase class C family)